MTNLLKPVMLATATIAILGACSTAPAADEQADEWRSDARLGERVDRICFRSSIDNFGQTTRNSVVVERGVNDTYLIETSGYCRDLKNALSLTFDSFPGSGCVTTGDSLYAYDSVFGPDETSIPSIQCPIRAIYKWDEDAVEEDASE